MIDIDNPSGCLHVGRTKRRSLRQRIAYRVSGAVAAVLLAFSRSRILALLLAVYLVTLAAFAWRVWGAA